MAINSSIPGARAPQRRHLRVVKRGFFGGGLQFDEISRAGDHNVHVDFGLRVFLIAEIQHGDAAHMPTLVAATKSRMGERFSLPNFKSWRIAMESAIKAPVIAAVRVPPSACSTSQSRMMLRSPSAARSITVRKRTSDQALNLHGAARRPALGDFARGAGAVARGSMEYSAVTQPLPELRKKGGTVSSTVAVHNTRV